MFPLQVSNRNMYRIVSGVFLTLLLKNAFGSDCEYHNDTLSPIRRQLLDFKLEHSKPIGVITTSAGIPVDIRKAVTLNTNIFKNSYFYDIHFHNNRERIPERITHVKGTGAFGYFKVTHDVSKYTKADVFNGIGKKTKVFCRFSYQRQLRGGSDLVRDILGLSVKFYTREGNLDMVAKNIPVFHFRDPITFPSMRAYRRNPKTNIVDSNPGYDFTTLRPDVLTNRLWLMSDFGISNGYRKMDAYPIHTYEVNNKHGESYFVRFNFRTEQGVELLSNEAARILRARDSDYSVTDLYNAIATENYPSWKLEMDVMSAEDILEMDYNPFDVTRLWKNGTYHTVTIGRMVLNENPDNHFRYIERAAFNPGNLVPGIPGPPDLMFKARVFTYPDALSYRLGKNYNNIKVNRPKYWKVYNRDGHSATLDNMRDAPNYYPNKFNGPEPYVDTAMPDRDILIYDRHAVDLQPVADFYNDFVTTEDHRNRLAENYANVLVNTIEDVQIRNIKMLYLIDRDLGRRVSRALEAARMSQEEQQPTLILSKQTHRITFLDVPNPNPSGSH